MGRDKFGLPVGFGPRASFSPLMAKVPEGGEPGIGGGMAGGDAAWEMADAGAG